MPQGIVQDLLYLGLVLVVESDTKQRKWVGTAIFTTRQALFGFGNTPNVALEALITTALRLGHRLPTVNYEYLEAIAQDLLQLILQRTDFPTDLSASWVATARFRRKWLFGRPHTITVTAAQPEEGLETLALRIKENIR